MRTDKRSRTGRIGIAGTQLSVERLGWIFREQPVEDYGIDAHIEAVENGEPTSRLLSLQIKSGKSWFKETVSDSFVFRGKPQHLKYWKEHPLPVLVVLYDDESRIAYWQIVNSETIQRTGKGWKLLIPFEQKIDESAVELFKQFSRKIISNNNYSILSQKDVSHGGAKRYSANALLTRECTKPEIIQIAKKIISKLKISEYYRNKQVKQHWQGKEAQVVTVFLYLSPDDVPYANWICAAHYIGQGLALGSSPEKQAGQDVGDGITVAWKANYKDFSSLLSERKLSKEEYLTKINEILEPTKIAVAQVIDLTDRFNTGKLSASDYANLLSALEIDVEKLGLEAARIGSAPIECADLNQRFKGLMALAHNIVLPFSPKGLETWREDNRTRMTNRAIKDYQNELQRLEFEFEKVR